MIGREQAKASVLAAIEGWAADSQLQATPQAVEQDIRKREVIRLRECRGGFARRIGMHSNECYCTASRPCSTRTALLLGVQDAKESLGAGWLQL